MLRSEMTLFERAEVVERVDGVRFTLRTEVESLPREMLFGETMLRVTGCEVRAGVEREVVPDERAIREVLSLARVIVGTPLDVERVGAGR